MIKTSKRASRTESIEEIVGGLVFLQHTVIIVRGERKKRRTTVYIALHNSPNKCRVNFVNYS